VGVDRRRLAFSSAVSVAVPGAALAGRGGEPNDGNGHSKACANVGKSKGKGPKANERRKAKLDNGRKCGLHKLNGSRQQHWESPST
jgi:hypothetical protein